MANNRIFIRCKECGKYLFLGKGFGGAYYTSDRFYEKDLITSLNEFYDEHAFCYREMLDEIENLKDFNNKLQATKDRLDKYDKENQTRIDKAIDYIKWNLDKNQELIEYFNYDGNFNELLNILKGEE